MNLHLIETGFLKLDGGAMFGVVPKVLWQKMQAADENNLCNWAMRCLLIEDGDKLILIDTGIGDKQSEKFLGHYHLNGDYSLHGSLAKKGFHADDITDVLLTHLHFDHVGGAVEWNERKDGYRTTFKNAKYHVCQDQWEWAIDPHERERASFLKENLLPIKESGQLQLFKSNSSPLANIELEYVYGHTEAMVLPKFKIAGQSYIYLADLIPSNSHIRLPFIMGYDIRPLETLKEKKRILKNALDSNSICLFEHDANMAACSLEMGKRGIEFGQEIKL